MRSPDDLSWCPSTTFGDALDAGFEVPESANRRTLRIPLMVHMYIGDLVSEYDGKISRTRFADAAIRYSANTIPAYTDYRAEDFKVLKREIRKSYYNYEVSDMGQLYEFELDHEPKLDRQTAFHLDYRLEEFLEDFVDYGGFESKWAAIRHLLYHGIYYWDWETTQLKPAERPLEICFKSVFKIHHGIKHHNGLIEDAEIVVDPDEQEVRFE